MHCRRDSTDFSGFALKIKFSGNETFVTHSWFVIKKLENGTSKELYDKKLTMLIYYHFGA